MSDAGPARGESPVGQRNPAASMSRRDRSSVGNECGAGFIRPLQGRDTSLRIVRITRVSAEMMTC